MYRKQMTLQRVFCLLAIAAAALIFIYALGYMTDVYDMIYVMRAKDKTPEINDFLAGMDAFNHQLLWVGIGMILISLLLFLTNTHTRRRYYIGNLIAVAVYACAAFAASVWAHIRIAGFRAFYLSGAIDFETVKSFADRSARNGGVSVYTDSTFWFDVHWFVFGIVLLAAVLLILNFVWKTRLMSAEKQALSNEKAVQS